jgi:YidC/Oxa1 family membrane protein insertase
MDTQRLILLFVFSFSLLMLWEAWQREQRPKPAATAPSPRGQEVVPGPSRAAPLPEGPAIVPGAAPATRGETVRLSNDLVVAEIDTLGASLKRLELLRHRDAFDQTMNMVLLGPERHYEAQSGLTGEGGPNHRTVWRAKPGDYALGSRENEVRATFTAEGANGLVVDKTYTLQRDSYVIGVAVEVRNEGREPARPFAYFQLTHNGQPITTKNTVAGSFGGQSFIGFALYSNERKFEKVAPSDVDKAKAEHVRQADNGWLGFMEHYFVSAWLPAQGLPREYVLERRADGAYAGRVLVALPPVAPGASARVEVPLYAGPQEQRRLKHAAPGLDLVVDYGFLAIIAWPLFWLLEKFHELSGNWGVAIILLTVLIKIIFFPLSAASYKSMARMKLITPRLTKLREMYANDRQKMNQAMMELYKTEKINPLGGCFPILVQIPVFIALYWVLLAAIELRHAPFILWIEDLSALDPYYVLPILMSVTMVLQTRMNPKPPDPVQAKVMQYMPYVFSVFFFFFPAGLVLYWLVNNILSILQQWQIQRMFNRDRPAHAKR